jgi:hypothetical protein
MIMKLRVIQSLIVIAFSLTVAMSVHAADLPLPSRSTPQPPAVSPGATSGVTTPKPTPVITVPPSAGSKLTYAGPTPNITAVANAIQVQAKSLNSLVTVAPGLALTKRVTISIAYLTPWPTGNDRRTQTYVPSSGNNFLYSDLEADGKARKIHMDITLSEPKLGGGVYSYNVPVDLTLDPLYDVTISPLVFRLVVGCSNVGANQIDLHWWAPDNSKNYQTVHFATKEGETFAIREFSWARSEVSATDNLHKVDVWYEETGIHGGFGPFPGSPKENLVPGKTQTSSPGLVNSRGSTQDCQATLDYTVTYQLRAYFGAPTVRDHR